MTTTTTATRPASNTPKAAEPVKRGWGNLPCPRCGEECAVAISLDDFGECRCYNCDEAFPTDELRTLLAKWAPVLRWLETAPQLED